MTTDKQKQVEYDSEPQVPQLTPEQAAVLEALDKQDIGDDYARDEMPHYECFSALSDAGYIKSYGCLLGNIWNIELNGINALQKHRESQHDNE